MSNSMNEKVPLFKRLGGMEAITAAVDLFYEKVLSDPELARFFTRTNIQHLKSQQVKFMAQAMGGPAQYKGRDMHKAHAHLGIQQEHFDKVAQHLVESLKELKVPQDMITEVVGLLGPLASEIVNPNGSPRG